MTLYDLPLIYLPGNDMNHKVCCKCHQSLPFSAFSMRKRKDGTETPVAHCRPCRVDINQEYQKAHPRPSQKRYSSCAGCGRQCSKQQAYCIPCRRKAGLGNQYKYKPCPTIGCVNRCGKSAEKCRDCRNRDLAAKTKANSAEREAAKAAKAKPERKPFVFAIMKNVILPVPPQYGSQGKNHEVYKAAKHTEILRINPAARKTDPRYTLPAKSITFTEMEKAILSADFVNVNTIGCDSETLRRAIGDLQRKLGARSPGMIREAAEAYRRSVEKTQMKELQVPA